MADPTVSLDSRRNYPRVEIPKGPAVACRGAGRQGICVVTSLGLGGLFIAEANPPDAGTTLQLLFEVQMGEVRARAATCYVVPGKGMGVRFVNMSTDDRSRLYQLLKKLL